MFQWKHIVMCSCSTKGRASLVIRGSGRGCRRGGGQKKRQELRWQRWQVSAIGGITN